MGSIHPLPIAMPFRGVLSSVVFKMPVAERRQFTSVFDEMRICQTECSDRRRVYTVPRNSRQQGMSEEEKGKPLDAALDSPWGKNLRPHAAFRGILRKS